MIGGPTAVVLEPGNATQRNILPWLTIISVFLATHRLLLEMGWDFKEQRFPASTDCYTRFLQELNQGDSFEIRSGVIESDSQSMKLGQNRSTLKLENSVQHGTGAQ